MSEKGPRSRRGGTGHRVPLSRSSSIKQRIKGGELPDVRRSSSDPNEGGTCREEAEASRSQYMGEPCISS